MGSRAQTTGLRQASLTAAGVRAQAEGAAELAGTTASVATPSTTAGDHREPAGLNAPLSAEERAELEMLRAERARLEQELSTRQAELQQSQRPAVGTTRSQQNGAVLGIFDALTVPKTASHEVGLKEVALLLFILGFLGYLLMKF